MARPGVTKSGLSNSPTAGACEDGGLSGPAPPGLEPEFGLYLLGGPPPAMPWETRWLRWPDFGLPIDKTEARIALAEAFARSLDERVEIACRSGTGRTGTALACLAVLAGTKPEQAVAYVRDNYRRRAVETPWQHAFVRRFGR